MTTRLAALYLVLLTLTGCTGVSLNSSAPEPLFYLIHPLPPEDAAASAGNGVTITIDRPKVAPGLDTDRIALYRNNGRMLDYFADGRWPEQLELILYAFLKEDIGAVIPVREDIQRMAPNETRYRMRMFVRDFQAEYEALPTGAPRTRVTLKATLENAGTGVIVLEHTSTADGEASSDSLQDITGSLEKNLRETLEDVRTRVSAVVATAE